MTNSESFARSIPRVISILKCFTPHNLELNAGEIAQKTGIPVTTTYRMLSGLTKGRFLERVDSSDKYRIGVELHILGNLYLSSQDVLNLADPVLKLINELTNESIFLGIFDNGTVILTAKEESRHPFRYSHHVGTILPAHATAMGKAFLAELSEQELDALYPDEGLEPITSKTITTKTRLKDELKRVQKIGVAFADEEGSEAISAVSTVIRNVTGKAIAAVSISFPIFRANKTRTEHLAKLVKMATGLISSGLGYQDPLQTARSLEDIRKWWAEEADKET